MNLNLILPIRLGMDAMVNISRIAVEHMRGGKGKGEGGSQEIIKHFYPIQQQLGDNQLVLSREKSSSMHLAFFPIVHVSIDRVEKKKKERTKKNSHRMLEPF